MNRTRSAGASVPVTAPADTDRGSALILALTLVMVFGLIGATIATFGAASLKHARVVRSSTSMRTTAEGALRLTLDQLKRHQTLCSDFGAPTQPLPLVTNDVQSVSVKCTNIGGANQGANSWAVILTGNDPTFKALVSSGGGSRAIGGSVYMAAATESNAAVTNLTLDGDFWYKDATCESPTPPTITGMTIIRSPPNAKICTTASWQSLISTILLPPKPPVRNPAGQDNLVPNCRIFFPGTYTSPPSLALQNYFVSGDYYFEFDGSWVVKQSTIIGGRADSDLGDTQYLPAPDCASAPTTAGLVGTGSGVTWLFGKGAWLDIQTQGSLELFRRMQGTQAVSVMAVQQSVNGYSRSTISNSAGGALINTDSGSNNNMVIHGLVYAPDAQIRFSNVSNSANSATLGGVVAASIHMQSSASATGFVISNTRMPSQTKILMKATATARDGVSAVVQTVIDYEPSRRVLNATVAGGGTIGTITVPAATPFALDDNGSLVTGPGLPGDAVLTVPAAGTTATVTSAMGGIVARTGVPIVVMTPRIAINSWRKV